MDLRRSRGRGRGEARLTASFRGERIGGCAHARAALGPAGLDLASALLLRGGEIALALLLDAALRAYVALREEHRLPIDLGQKRLVAR
jgi:hypothetical protein